MELVEQLVNIEDEIAEIDDSLCVQLTQNDEILKAIDRQNVALERIAAALERISRVYHESV